MVRGGAEAGAEPAGCWAPPVTETPMNRNPTSTARTNVFIMLLRLLIVFLIAVSPIGFRAVAISISVAVRAIVVCVEVLKPLVNVVHNHSGDRCTDANQHIAGAKQCAFAGHSRPSDQH